MRILDLSDKSLKKLPVLKNGVEYLYCDGNLLTSLGELPVGLVFLYCYNNKLTSLPKLPDSLKELHCHRNKLKVLPELPDSLKEMRCDNNPLECLIPTKFLQSQENKWLNNYYYRYIETYEGQKKILVRDVSMMKELQLQTELHPKIKKEFDYILNGCDLNLL